MYPHRDDRDAAQVVRLVASNVELSEQLILDLGCGPGRHAKHLIEHGARVVGLDLSRPLLDRAVHATPAPLAVVRGDMRFLPFATNSFDAVMSFFTSFGYFESDEENEQVLKNVAEVLVPCGVFVLDYLNAGRLMSDLVPHEETQLGNHNVVIDRRISRDRKFVHKEMNLVDEGRQFFERVRLFSPDELSRLLQNAGFRVKRRFGDYGGGAMDQDSPRTLLIAELQ